MEPQAHDCRCSLQGIYCAGRSRRIHAHDRCRFAAPSCAFDTVVYQLTERVIPRVDGRLSLDFEVAPSARSTVLTVREARPPLKVIRAFEVDDGAALVHLHNVSGGVLGGDRLSISVRVGPQARVQLTTTSATRLYKSRADSPGSTQTMDISIGEDGVLELLPDPLIPFARSSYTQRTRIDLADGAGLFCWETVAPGREARGELVAYDLLALDTAIWACGKPIALEHARLEPRRRHLESPARLGVYRYFSTFYICRANLAASHWVTLESELMALAESMNQPGEILWGVSALAAH